MTRLPLTCLLVCLSVNLASCAKDPSSSQNNGNNNNGGAPGSAGSNPYQPIPNGSGNVSGEKNFASLIKARSQGKPESQPWAGSWWPYSSGGISEAAALYDRVKNSGAANWESSNHGPSIPGLQDWWGHCNGWAAAAALYKEPRAPKSVGGVSFAVADQKALLTEVAMEVSADFFGMRAETNSGPAFNDVAPDQFFLVLTNYTGLGKQLALDRYTGDQVWNQPVAGYQIAPIKPEDYLGASPSAANVYRVNVSTQLWWARDDVAGGHLTEPFEFKDSASFESRTLRYELWLDGPVVFGPNGEVASSGNVILARQGNVVTGGTWKNGNMEPANSHPDYLWVPHGLQASTGYSNPKLDGAYVASQFGR